eukprot:312804-Chlamydomonas_euryale.AAC.1
MRTATAVAAHQPHIASARACTCCRCCRRHADTARERHVDDMGSRICWRGIGRMLTGHRESSLDRRLDLKPDLACNLESRGACRADMVPSGSRCRCRV